MQQDYVRSGKFSDRELAIILKEAEKYKHRVFTAQITSRKEDTIDSYVDEDMRKSEIYFPTTNEAYRTFNLIQSRIIQEYAGQKINVADVSEVQFVHYPLGGKFKWHMDITDTRVERMRGLTFSMNLTDPSTYDGGTLHLAVSKNKTITLDREPGSFLIFPSFMKHKVDEITRGFREVIVVWSHLSRNEVKAMR